MSRIDSRTARMAATAVLLCLPQLLRPAPVQAQAIRRAITNIVGVITGQLETAVTDGGAPDVRAGRPPSLLGCSELYDQNINTVGRGAELVRDYTAWIVASYRVLERTRGPLPICFEWTSDRVDTNLARTLIKINNVFIDNDSMPHPRAQTNLHFWDGYNLVGHNDEPRLEPDPALARRRAEAIQTQSTGVTCRFVPSTNPQQTEQVYHRKVTYTYRPVVDKCPR